LQTGERLDPDINAKFHLFLSQDSSFRIHYDIGAQVSRRHMIYAKIQEGLNYAAYFKCVYSARSFPDLNFTLLGASSPHLLQHRSGYVHTTADTFICCIYSKHNAKYTSLLPLPPNIHLFLIYSVNVPMPVIFSGSARPPNTPPSPSITQRLMTAVPHGESLHNNFLCGSP
jgi:hypothetical protein